MGLFSDETADADASRLHFSAHMIAAPFSAGSWCSSVPSPREVAKPLTKRQ
jgi:hypothetical protein